MIFYTVLVCCVLIVSGLTSERQTDKVTTLFPAAVSDGDEDYLPKVPGIEVEKIIPQEKRNIRCPPMSRFWSYIPCYRKEQQREMTKSELIEKIKKYIMKHYHGRN